VAVLGFICGFRRSVIRILRDDSCSPFSVITSDHSRQCRFYCTFGTFGECHRLIISWLFWNEIRRRILIHYFGTDDDSHHFESCYFIFMRFRDCDNLKKEPFPRLSEIIYRYQQCFASCHRHVSVTFELNAQLVRLEASAC
jgi:hypothetical protein